MSTYSTIAKQPRPLLIGSLCQRGQTSLAVLDPDPDLIAEPIHGCWRAGIDFSAFGSPSLTTGSLATLKSIAASYLGKHSKTPTTRKPCIWVPHLLTTIIRHNRSAVHSIHSSAVLLVQGRGKTRNFEYIKAVNSRLTDRIDAWRRQAGQWHSEHTYCQELRGQSVSGLHTNFKVQPAWGNDGMRTVKRPEEQRRKRIERARLN